jgi:two-component system cell cycle sensor histidine kinase/response regulator CckA
MTPTDNPLGNESESRDETVLVVEDHIEVRNVFRQVLVRTGFRILEATNGEDALDVCDRLQGKVDLLITDVIMPRMGGQELARHLMMRYPHMKVLYVSGYSVLDIEEQGALDPHGDFLPKPFLTEVLASKVLELIGVPARTNSRPDSSRSER